MSLNALGLVLLQMGDLKTARSYCEQALAIDIQAFGEKRLETAASLNNLALVLQALGDYPTAGMSVSIRPWRSNKISLA